MRRTFGKSEKLKGAEGEVESRRNDLSSVSVANDREEEVEIGAPPEFVSRERVDPQTIFLAGLFVLGLLAAAYVAEEILLPLALALVLKFLLQPAMRWLESWHVPRTLAALMIILTLFGAIIGLGTAISGPASTWAAKLPDGIPRLQERLSFLAPPITAVQRFLRQVENFGVPTPPSPVPATAPPADGSSLGATIFAGTRSFASGLFTTVLFLFFLLGSGDTFLRRFVEVLPHFKDKRQAVDISQQVERDISSYLVTITIMNALVGIATGLVMWLTGVGDPLLWAAIAFILNYVPILGPLAGVGIFLLAGLLTIESLWLALLPAALYLLIHLAEGETFTPMLLARRFTLNPVIVIVGLVFWFWMWGALGAILSIPLLAIVKIISDRVGPLTAFGHFLEG